MLFFLPTFHVLYDKLSILSVTCLFLQIQCPCPVLYTISVIVFSLIEFWSYPLGCSFFWFLSDFSRCLFASLFNSASICGSWLSLSYLLPVFLHDIMYFSFCSLLFVRTYVLQPAFTFLDLWIWPLPHIAAYCTEGHSYFLFLTWGSSLGDYHIFSPMWLLLFKAVKRSTKHIIACQHIQ